ncbi:MAG: hypothetical protein ACK5PB_18590 [Pirellula sp.]|jgi:hypothetical protein
MSTIDSLAIHFIRHGQWADAVQLYRDELGLSIAQAEMKVYGLASEYEIQEPKRLLLWLWIALGGFSIILFSLFLSNYRP